MKIFVIIASLIIAMILVPTALLNDTGGVSGVVKVIGIGGALVTFLRPKIGIYLITLETCYADYFKKLATYYGVPAQITVIEILSMSMLTIGMLWLSIVMNMLLTRTRPNKPQVYFLIAVILYCLLIITINGLGVSAVQSIVNGAGIFGIVFAISYFYPDPQKQMMKYLRHILIILLPWPIMGLVQYYGDYTAMDYWYSNTTLSFTNVPLAGLALLNGVNFPIGLGSSPLHFGSIGFMYLLSLWHALTFKKHRWFYLACFLLYLVAIFHTNARAAMLAPMLILTLYFLFKKRRLFIASVSGGVIAALLLVLLSQEIVDNIEYLDDLIANAFFWVEDKRLVTITTLIARIRPLTNFTDPEYWSLFGQASYQEVKASGPRDKFYSHNILASIFFIGGFTGLLAVFIPAFLSFKALLKFLYIRRDNIIVTKMIRFGVAFCIIRLMMLMLLGANIATQPMNLMTSIPAGLILCASIKSRVIRRPGEIIPVDENLRKKINRYIDGGQQGVIAQSK